MRTNYVLIDSENVHPQSLDGLEPDQFQVLIFVGACCAKLPFGLVSALQQLGSRARYIKISGNGPNALDFHVAFSIGELAASEPTAYFHVVSKDVGFDPLIQHLRARKLFADRVKSIAEIPIIRTTKCRSPIERANLVMDSLGRPKATKPGTLNTLAGTIAHLFRGQITEEEISATIAGWSGAISSPSSTRRSIITVCVRMVWG